MKRDIKQLGDGEFDVLVIGAGINGACVARDAAMRGLRTALVDAGDFGAGTSSNSLRIVHGGLRYLQHLDFRRMRESIRERSMWLRIAPHLVHPLPCLAATSGRGMRSRMAFRAAFAVNDLVGWDRNRGLEASRRLAAGRLLSRDETLKLYPGGDAATVTGGAVWSDGQMFHSERLVLAVLADAVRCGAVVANYVRVDGLEVAAGRIRAVRVRDEVGGEDFEIRAKVTVNASGPAVDRLVGRALGRTDGKCRVVLSKAMNLLTKRIAGRVAVGVPSRYRDPNSVVDHGSRLLFVTPWRGLSMTGTTHFAFEGDPADFRVTEADVAGFVAEINAACPAAKLTLDDVAGVLGGLLPAVTGKEGEAGVRLMQHHRVMDHARLDGVEGLVSLVGVKYTTSRMAAEQVVDLVCRKSAMTARKCETGQRALFEMGDDGYDAFEAAAVDRLKVRMGDEAAAGLTRMYGAEVDGLLSMLDGEGSVGEAELDEVTTRWGVRREMAVRLGDVVFRRSDLGSCGRVGEERLRRVARVMADEMGWDENREREEIDVVRKGFRAWCGSVEKTTVARASVEKVG